jgi:hypothetical protein
LQELGLDDLDTILDTIRIFGYIARLGYYWLLRFFMSVSVGDSVSSLLGDSGFRG